VGVVQYYRANTMKIENLEKIISQRIENRDNFSNSYTVFLKKAGRKKIAEKLGEESIETIIEIIKSDKKRIIYETADLIYHLMVALSISGIKWKDIESELEKRNIIISRTRKTKSKPHLYILLHVHKCAGSTLRHHIIRSLKSGEYLIFRKSVDSDFEDRQKIEKYLKKQSRDKLKKIRFITGHGTFYGIHKFFPDSEPRYIVFLRNPFLRTVSNYNFFVQTKDDGHGSRKSIFDSRHHVKDFKSWFTKTDIMQNYITRFLRLRVMNVGMTKKLTEKDIIFIKNVFKDFYFIGLTERQEDYLFLYGLFGVKRFYEDRNVSVRYYEPGRQDEIIFKKMNQFDYEIYEDSIQLNKKFRLNKKNNYNKVVGKVRKMRGKTKILKNKYKKIERL